MLLGATSGVVEPCQSVMEFWSFEAMTNQNFAAVAQSLSSTIHETVGFLLATLIALDFTWPM
jgi:cytochrome b